MRLHVWCLSVLSLVLFSLPAARRPLPLVFESGVAGGLVGRNAGGNVTITPAQAELGAIDTSLARAGLAGPDPAPGKLLLVAADRQPLAFEPNVGQTDPQVRFLTRSPGMMVFFTDTEAVMVLRQRQENGNSHLGRPRHRHARSAAEHQVVRMKLTGGAVPQTAGLEKLPGVSNYFIGNDPAKWRTDIPHYARIRYNGVYPGIDMLCYGNGGQLEYDLVVAPGADPRRIELAWDGVDRIGRNADGDLVLGTRLGELVQKRPRVYQETGGRRVEVAARYVVGRDRRVTLALARYDRGRPLVIDPVLLVYSTYLGGSGDDNADSIAVDANGAAYVAGDTDSANFPTQSAYQTTYAGDTDVFVSKFSAAGNTLLYSTYLGGKGDDEPEEIAVDGAFSAYVTGSTTSGDFPTQSAYQSSYSGDTDAFVAKLAPSGNALVYSTYLGGSGEDEGYCLVVDGAGSAYVTGYTASANFPTQSAYQSAYKGGTDAFVAKLAPSGKALDYSTYLGGSNLDIGFNIAVDGSGSAYVAGCTESTDFPLQSPYEKQYLGGCAPFVAKLGQNGSTLVYSTYLGLAMNAQTSDQSEGVAVDGSGAAYITGSTRSQSLTTVSAFQTTSGGSLDVFVAKLSPAGNALEYSTYLGGSGDEEPYGVAVDAAGAAYVSGYTTSLNFPTQSPFQAQNRGGEDVFVTKLGPAGNVLAFSTYLGGSGDEISTYVAVDGAGAAYVAGFTTSKDFPTASPYQASNKGSSNAFVAKLQLPVAVATNPVGLAISVDGASLTAPQGFDWAAGATHSIGASSPQGTGSTRYAFTNWSDGGGPSHSITASSTATTYIASFGTQYQLAASASPAAGGTVSASPASTDGYYNSGTQVQLTAKANAGYQFSNWSGDLTGNANPQPLAMSAPRSVTAAFISTPPSGNPVNIAEINVVAGGTNIAQNTWIEIHGTGLAPASVSAGGDTWSNAPEFASGKMPTALDGVSVSVNGKPAYIYYVSATQVNVLTPLDSTTGPVQVTLTNGSNTSAPFTVNLEAVAPAFLQFGSGPYIAALHGDNSLVGPASMSVPGYTFTPAQPGETIVLYGAGFGMPGSALTAGSSTQQSALPNLPVITIGGSQATVIYAGVVSPGLYQFNVTVPLSAGNGDNGVVATYGGASTPAGAMISVSR
jgi:uncharacterized protein (TIGR03437 family)